MRNFNDFRTPILRTSIVCASIVAYPLNLRDRKTKIAAKWFFLNFIAEPVDLIWLAMTFIDIWSEGRRKLSNYAFI